jgi:hypothetical protein
MRVIVWLWFDDDDGGVEVDDEGPVRTLPLVLAAPRVVGVVDVDMDTPMTADGGASAVSASTAATGALLPLCIA